MRFENVQKCCMIQYCSAIVERCGGMLDIQARQYDSAKFPAQ